MTKRTVFELRSAEDIAKLKGKYLLNGKTLHIVGGCHYTKSVFKHSPIFETEDEVIASETRYFHHCKFCFKGK